MARNRRSQVIHDKEIHKLAKIYRSKGYKVTADVRGWETPENLYGKKPDLIVKKKGHITAVEVETPDSVGSARDKKQKTAFKKWSAVKGTRHYKRIVTGR